MEGTHWWDGNAYLRVVVLRLVQLCHELVRPRTAASLHLLLTQRMQLALQLRHLLPQQRLLLRRTGAGCHLIELLLQRRLFAKG